MRFWPRRPHPEEDGLLVCLKTTRREARNEVNGVMEMASGVAFGDACIQAWKIIDETE